MRITRQAVLAARTCAICERTLLVGERSVRYSPDGESFFEVCPLCQETALEHGWLKEGSPTSPVVADSRRRRRLGPLASLFEPRKPEAEPVVDEPILRRLSGVNSEVVLTVAWEISWYQYRITPESGQPVRLEERGHDPGEVEPMFTSWNARLAPDGRIVPEISPV